ncbi:peptide deformylase [Arthrobacter cryoconiti]|uniref:Peptide deformylase n=1 Tax=Arthrobacter cryoconiti TaxID=748907 RepID=A0ABV8R1L4_9MICC|nr:peptide deformylase [Arthrobacter cryoconiti]MCC9069828.1 peptide deformylase [Arthrobacter cryoconiti]
MTSVGPAAYSDSYVVETVAQILAAGTLPGIIQCGNPVLRAQAVEYTGQLNDADLAELINLMRRTMLAAPGVGLAAPQIGIPLQLAVLEDLYEIPQESAVARKREHLEFFAILNPRYMPLDLQREAHYEGCLSVSGWQAVVERHASIELTYDGELGSPEVRKFSGWQARIVQHETDHLAGTLYVDKALMRSLCSSGEYLNHWAHPDISAARIGLNF